MLRSLTIGRRLRSASPSPQLPTLRHELTISLAVTFAGAFVVAAAGVVFLVPRLESVGTTVLYLAVLLVADIAIFASFGRYLIRRRLLGVLDDLVEGAESIAAGDYARRLPTGETAEISRVADALNRMAERLISHQAQLAANVRSLEETNRLLTEARDELVHAEKAASVGRLGAGIAHEVGNPLSAIIGYIGLLQRTAGAEEQDLLASAEREARRIDRIVRGLLDYARPREARVYPIDVNDVVARGLELLVTQGRFQQVRLERSLAEGLPEVEADPYQVEQVLVNLLLNATDALEGAAVVDAEVVVTTARVRVEPKRREPSRRRDDPPDVDYSHRRRFHQAIRFPRELSIPAGGGEVVEIVVRDNGPGIPADVADQIFEPFVTTKEPGKGTGLGLAVAARLIDAMGGTIRLESEEGRGTEFTIVLPAWSGGATEPSER
jgi:signal transduction histidine kinase